MRFAKWLFSERKPNPFAGLQAMLRKEPPAQLQKKEVLSEPLQKNEASSQPASGGYIRIKKEEPIFDSFTLSLLLSSSLSSRTKSFDMKSRLCDEKPQFEIEDVTKKLEQDYEQEGRITLSRPAVSRIPIVFSMIGLGAADPSKAKGMKYLDLAGGSSNSVFMNEAEPWDARFLHECGAEVHLVDIGRQILEKFPTHQLDLTKEGALGRFPSNHFDCIACLSLMDFADPAGVGALAYGDISPFLRKITDEEDRVRTRGEIVSQATRLLKEGGFFVTIYDVYLTAFQKQGERLFSAEKNAYL